MVGAFFVAGKPVRAMICGNANHSQWKTMTLDQLLPTQRATVLAIDLPFELRERLAALGVKVGRQLELIHRLGRRGPLQVRAGSTDFILRAAEAAGIEVRF